MGTETTLPEVISSPSERWFAALVPTREEAVETLIRVVGFEYEGLADELTEIRVQPVPVPLEHRDEYHEWFEVSPEGQIVAWEIRT